jgi:signal transduction histidine kinase
MFAQLQRVLKSYSFQFFLSTSLIFVVVSILIFALLFAYFTRQQSIDLQESIKNELDRVERVYNDMGRAEFIDTTNHLDTEYTISNFYYLLINTSGKKVAGDLNQWPGVIPKTKKPLLFSIERQSIDRSQTKTIDLTGLAREMADGSTLLVARNLRIVQIFLQNYQSVLLLFFIVSVTLSIFIALIFSVLSLSRLEKFNVGIDHIMSGDLSERFAVKKSKAETEQLARNLNKMLNMITSLINDVKRVSDNVAHDLRTPLTRHRNNLVTVKNAIDEVHSEAIQQLIIETDQLLATFNALLRIAKIESGNASTPMTPTTLRPLISDVIELYEPLAADAGIDMTVELAGHPVIMGDRNLLFQAIANLVDNAIKYTPTGGTIRFKLMDYLVDSGYPVLQGMPNTSDSNSSDERNSSDADLAHSFTSLSISDSGPGVQSGNYKKMFQRFYREEKSRGLKPGNGLGLSMVYATMKLHQGAILVASNNPGLNVTLVFRQH